MPRSKATQYLDNDELSTFEHRQLTEEEQIAADKTEKPETSEEPTAAEPVINEKRLTFSA